MWDWYRRQWDATRRFWRDNEDDELGWSGENPPGCALWLLIAVGIVLAGYLLVQGISRAGSPWDLILGAVGVCAGIVLVPFVARAFLAVVIVSDMWRWGGE